MSNNNQSQTLVLCVVDLGESGYMIYEDGFNAGQHIVYGIQKDGVSSRTLPDGIEGTNYTMWGKPWSPPLESTQSL